MPNQQPKQTLGELWHKAENMTGNEFAVGYNDSGCFWHFSWGNRGAGSMIEGIGYRYDSDAETIEGAFTDWIKHLEQTNA